MVVFKFFTCLCLLLALGGQGQVCQAEEIRISRPQVTLTHDCCGSIEINCESGKIHWPGSVVDAHRHWQLRYVQPVFCPMITCMSSCGNYADACVLDSTAVLLNKSHGCTGSCR